MTEDELKALAQRVMQATEPDREIDALVKAAVYGGAAMLSPFNGQWCIYRAGQEHLDIKARKTMDCPLNVSHKTWSADTFTTSIEAAMTLVPDGWDYGFAWFGPRGSGAQVWPRGERTDPRIIGARAASPACALTAAALLALAAQERAATVAWINQRADASIAEPHDADPCVQSTVEIMAVAAKSLAVAIEAGAHLQKAAIKRPYE